MSSHGVFTIIICKHKGYLYKTYVVLVCGKYNTSVHKHIQPNVTAGISNYNVNLI